MLSRHSVGTYQGNEFTCNSSGNTQSQSSQLADPLRIDPGIKSGISVRELSPHKNKQTNKQTQPGNESRNLLPKNPRNEEKATTHVRVRTVTFSSTGSHCWDHVQVRYRRTKSVSEFFAGSVMATILACY